MYVIYRVSDAIRIRSYADGTSSNWTKYCAISQAATRKFQILIDGKLVNVCFRVQHGVSSKISGLVQVFYYSSFAKILYDLISRESSCLQIVQHFFIQLNEFYLHIRYLHVRSCAGRTREIYSIGINTESVFYSLPRISCRLHDSYNQHRLTFVDMRTFHRDMCTCGRVWLKHKSCTLWADIGGSKLMKLLWRAL